MKSLPIIAILSVLLLTGCYPAYHRGYSGYSSGYGTGYGVRGYSDYPASVYYRQSTAPGYSYRYSTPRHDYGQGRGMQHYDWDGGQKRHDHSRRQAGHNWVGSHHDRVPEVQNRRNYRDRNASWQGAPHADHYGRRSDGGGISRREHGGNRREGGSGPHHGHDGRR